MVGAFKTDNLATALAAIIVISGNLLLSAFAILYGTPVAPFEFPEIVRIYYRGRSRTCTGSILSRQWIITSTFCFTNSFSQVRNYSDFIVNVGDDDAHVREPSEQNLTIVDVIFQDRYK